MSDQDRKLAPGERLEHGTERTALAATFRKRYESNPNMTIRQLADSEGRSFVWMRTMLLEAGTVLRPRGGYRRRSRPSGSTVR